MSDASHASEAHAPHAHEAYEGKPADSIPPDEPHTPGWLPIVGAALVLCGIMTFALTRSGDDEGQAAAAASAAAAPAEAPEPAPAPAPRPAVTGDNAMERLRQAIPAGSAPGRLPGLPSGVRPVRRPPPDGAAAPGAQPRPKPAP
ncbi:MAG TPA: hypothetical protein VM686_19545 [Polyangiaceae bacterium]|nr:hypothetical protein [Polyangiaceae bacterium]